MGMDSTPAVLAGSKASWGREKWGRVGTEKREESGYMDEARGGFHGQILNCCVGLNKKASRDLRSPIWGLKAFPSPEEILLAVADPARCSSSYFATAPPRDARQLRIGLSSLSDAWKSMNM